MATIHNLCTRVSTDRALSSSRSLSEVRLIESGVVRRRVCNVQKQRFAIRSIRIAQESHEQRMSSASQNGYVTSVSCFLFFLISNENSYPLLRLLFSISDYCALLLC